MRSRWLRIQKEWSSASELQRKLARSLNLLLFHNFFCFILLRSLSFEGKTLFCAFNRRFDPSFRDAYNKVRKGNQENLILVFFRLQVRSVRCSKCRASAGTPRCHPSPISGKHSPNLKAEVFIHMNQFCRVLPLIPLKGVYSGPLAGCFMTAVSMTSTSSPG